MQRFLKILGCVGLVLAGFTVVAAGYAYAVPDHEVEISHKSGECRKVTYKGEILPDGCQMVARGEISRYDHYYGK